ncbi:sigma factor-like helix-turn-helix DNA-binding protein [Paenibacillus sp. MMS20-IR301]|uniref:sigma factor-like helix-turn-helix DNA-binding protein n=1 Tax=Paenibacillus sp. MMS20-IR301 TaxID=2895946 RepID=UPI0028F076CD|nr:sigma factor-like helix-turn-helix DNA-binding protein [Paenibacillus sp. MMS20-IR301]WNS41900.1 sigma factor-like helix-turn-helix DNA-binding protein [Paenibacillus sp. MMS20-IR301]
MHSIANEKPLKLFQEYKQNHPILFKDKIIQSFFDSEIHRKLLERGLKGSSQAGRQLEAAFRGYYFEFRFTSFIDSIIKFHAIGRMRQNHKYRKRNLLIFDQSGSEEGEQTLGDILISRQHTLPEEDFNTCSPDFIHSINNDKLAESYAALTSRQQTIIKLRYGLCYRDREIAEMLDISPQAVGNNRNKALRNLRTRLHAQ